MDHYLTNHIDIHRNIKNVYRVLAIIVLSAKNDIAGITMVVMIMYILLNLPIQSFPNSSKILVYKLAILFDILSSEN